MNAECLASKKGQSKRKRSFAIVGDRKGHLEVKLYLDITEIIVNPFNFLEQFEK